MGGWDDLDFEIIGMRGWKRWNGAKVRSRCSMFGFGLQGAALMFATETFEEFHHKRSRNLSLLVSPTTTHHGEEEEVEDMEE